MRSKHAYLFIPLLILLTFELTSWSDVAYAKDLLRIEIKKDGVYYLSQSAIQKAGIPPNTINPSTIKIFNQGVEIPIHVHGEEDHSLDPPDYIEFYARGISRDSEYHDFTDINIYWVEWGGDDGKRMITRDGTPGNSPPPLSFIDRLHIETDWRWWREKPENEENDYWFWDKIWATGEEEYTFKEKPFPIKNLDKNSNGCAVRVSVHGITDVFTSPDHHTTISLNDIPLIDKEWNGMVPEKLERKIPCSNLNEGNNYLKIEAVKVPVTDTDWIDILDIDGDGFLDIDSIYLNWFEIDYRKTYRAYNNYLRFTGAGNGPVDFALHNFYLDLDPNFITILDITEYPDNIHRFNNIKIDNKSPNPVYFRDSLTYSQEKEYVATVINNPIGKPDKIEKYSLSSVLKNATNRADYIIITDEDLFESARRLSDYRSKYGLKTAVIKINDIYDEFSHGIFTPKAIREFLKHAYTNWSLPPKYVVLFGDANYDYKNNYGYGEPNMVPTYLVPGEFGLIFSDNWFADIEGDVLPEIIIGRISVKNAEEADIVVDKIIGYESSQRASWQKNLLFVADDDGYEFEGLSDKLAGSLPQDYTGNKVYMSTYYDLIPDDQDKAMETARQDVANNINNGTLMTVYIGHGDIDQWADENMTNSYLVLGTYGVESLLNNYDKLSFVITLNCLNGSFAYPNEGGISKEDDPWDIPLAEAFLKFDQGGAFAVWAPTSLGYTTEHSALASHLFDAIFRDGVSIMGEAILRAKTLAYRDNDIREDLVHMYTFFGDPAGRLPMSNKEASNNTSGGSGGGGCFIATAAYGSYLDPHVKALRDFRDTYLLTNRIGKVFVEFYYTYSPPVAELIRKHEFLRIVTRIILTPIVYAIVYPWYFLGLILFILFVIFPRKWWFLQYPIP